MFPSLTSAAALLTLASMATAKPLSTSPMGNNMKARSMMLAPFFAPPAAVAHNAINDSYIIILKPDAVVSDHVLMAQDAHSASPLDFTGGIRHVYDSVHIKGYSGRFSPTAVKRLRGMPEVAYIEQDQLVHAVDIETQKSSPWGLARISHRSKLSLSTFTKYEYDPEGGEGVDVYVIDTGINIHHKEFQGRARWGKTVPTDASDVDNNGHGTHCAGTIASAAYGVAKKAHVIAVKVLGDNGSGSMADVVGGVVWASEQAQKKLKDAQAEFRSTGKSSHKGSVANMSLGGGKSNALDQVVNAAVEAGLHMAVAAGNDNRDACSYSPAAAENAVTVGASTLDDQRAYFSNFGSCVDIFAPGLNILSTWIGSDTARNSISGTSMASPHTAGLLAYLLSLYPSKRFDPYNEAGVFDVDAQLNHEQTALMSALQDAKPAFLLNWLPYLPGGRFVSKLLGRVVAPAVEVAAPVPGGPGSITPLQLKKALIALGTRGALEEESIGKSSPNVLIFNNATSESY